uniref:CaiB/BaiF CoA transferase family protein n=1 Tax=Cellvibrio fontiphilus TaxID=1815559 RepID=UPI002B4BEF94|nr:CaiB/BaiF CoA-transferase family protein [Cellvibrio fontiphilus]
MNSSESHLSKQRPLDGVRIIEVGQLIAGPFAGCVLGYFGAEIIKIEPPEGDAIRNWRILENGTSFWWRSIGRNKKSITLDLKKTEGQDIARQLIEHADVVIENFRPGVMESWGLGPEVFKISNPGLIYARISGYGQTGPYASKPGFASVCEGISGFRYVNGFPNQAPVRPNLSIGDTISGIHAALGVALALLQRNNSGEGQMVDVALYESMFNLMEAVVPEFSGAGVVREPSGTTVTGIVPTNTYRCRNGKYVVIGGNGDSIFQRLMQVAGHPEMATDPRMANNAGRVQHELEIDNALAAWCMSKDADEILQLLEQARVPAGPIYSVKDMFADPHFAARGMFEQVQINGKPLQLPAIAPKLSQTPGVTDWPGGDIGSHTLDILQDVLNFTPEQIEHLKISGVI